MPTRQSRMEIYAGIAQGTMSRVLYRRLRRSFGAFRPRAMRKPSASCMAMFSAVHKSVVPSADIKPESSLKSALA